LGKLASHLLSFLHPSSSKAFHPAGPNKADEMKHHFNKFQGIINELPAMGINFDDEIHGWWLLESLPNYLEYHCLTQMF